MNGHRLTPAEANAAAPKVDDDDEKNEAQETADDDESSEKGYDDHGEPSPIPAHAEAEIGDIGKSQPLSDHGEAEEKGYKEED